VLDRGGRTSGSLGGQRTSSGVGREMSPGSGQPTASREARTPYHGVLPRLHSALRPWGIPATRTPPDRRRNRCVRAAVRAGGRRPGRTVVRGRRTVGEDPQQAARGWPRWEGGAAADEAGRRLEVGPPRPRRGREQATPSVEQAVRVTDQKSVWPANGAGRAAAASPPPRGRRGGRRERDQGGGGRAADPARQMEQHRAVRIAGAQEVDQRRRVLAVGAWNPATARRGRPPSGAGSRAWTDRGRAGLIGGREQRHTRAAAARGPAPAWHRVRRRRGGAGAGAGHRRADSSRPASPHAATSRIPTQVEQHAVRDIWPMRTRPVAVHERVGRVEPAA